MALGQRFTKLNLRLVGRHPSDYAQQLQELLEDLWRFTMGIPGGFLNTAATAIQAGVAAAAGTVAASWAAANHVHNILTAAPAGLSNSNSEGSGTSLLRADAGIKRDVRIFVNGVELVTRNAINLEGLVVTDEGAVLDRVKVSSSSSASSSARAQEILDYELYAAFEALCLRQVIQSTFR